MYDLDQLRREEFPFSANVTYLNHAAIAPLPQRSKREIQLAVEGLSSNPSDYFMRQGLPGPETMSVLAARYINAASPTEIATTTSTSAAGLTRYGAEKLRAAGYEVITPLDAAGPILTFCSPFDSATTDRLIQHLAERQLVAGKHLDAEGDAYVRLSFHAYNVPAEIDRFLSEMGAFVS